VFIPFFAVYSLAVAMLSVVVEQRWLLSFLFPFLLSFPFFLLFHSLSLSFGFLLFFFANLPTLSISVFASFFVSHGPSAVIDDWEDGGSWGWLWWLWQEATVERETERGAVVGTRKR
jgi:hypothetical protein